MSETAKVLEIRPPAGEGQASEVLFKGCTLACDWCHTPDSISPDGQLLHSDARCTGCRVCVSTCPNGAICMGPDGRELIAEKCTSCGDCVDTCPSGALELLGADWTVQDLARQVAGQGRAVSISGGEPLLQARAVGSFLDRCRELGLWVSLDTCGHCGADDLLGLVGRAHLVLYDLKAIDPVRHERYTGQSNRRILGNLLALAEAVRDSDGATRIWIRTPLVPGTTATDGNLSGIGAFIGEHLADVVDRWELCAFDDSGAERYRRLGQNWPYAGVSLMAPRELERLCGVARASGVDPSIVRVTGTDCGQGG